MGVRPGGLPNCFAVAGPVLGGDWCGRTEAGRPVKPDLRCDYSIAGSAPAPGVVTGALASHLLGSRKDLPFSDSSRGQPPGEGLLPISNYMVGAKDQGGRSHFLGNASVRIEDRKRSHAHTAGAVSRVSRRVWRRSAGLGRAVVDGQPIQPP